MKQTETVSGEQVPSGLDGPRPSGDSVAPPLESAGYSDCRQRSDRERMRRSTVRTKTMGGQEARVLPGVSFAVIFSGYDIFKQFSSCDPDGHKHCIRSCDGSDETHNNKQQNTR